MKKIKTINNKSAESYFTQDFFMFFNLFVFFFFILYNTNIRSKEIFFN